MEGVVDAGDLAGGDGLYCDYVLCARLYGVAVGHFRIVELLVDQQLGDHDLPTASTEIQLASTPVNPIAADKLQLMR